MHHLPLQSRFRLKLILLLVLVSGTISGVGTALLYFSWREDIMNHLQGRADSISASLAAAIDGDQHQKIRSRKDEKAARYKEIQNLLQRTMEENRKIHPPGVKAEEFIRYVYTMRKLSRDGFFEFVVDAQADETEISHVGDPYDATDDITSMNFIWEHGYSDGKAKVISDRWGDWISGGAGIRTDQGEIVGIVGVDISAKSLGELQTRILMLYLIIFAGCLVVSIAVSLPMGMRISQPVVRLIKEIGRVGQGDLEAFYPRRKRDDFHELGEAFNQMVEKMREGRLVRELLNRYLDPEIAQKIMQDSKTLSDHGERIKASVVFADLRGFTALSVDLEAEDLLKILNIYFEALLKVITEFEGMVDKFIGDGILVIFGPPLSHENDPLRAVKMAVRMDEVIPDCREKVKQLMGKDYNLGIGIGISTGWVVAGNVGAETRRDYTVIGEAVNMASRLQEIAQAGEIILSEQTYRMLHGEMGDLPRETINLRGFPDEMFVFRLEVSAAKDSTSQIRDATT